MWRSDSAAVRLELKGWMRAPEKENWTRTNPSGNESWSQTVVKCKESNWATLSASVFSYLKHNYSLSLFCVFSGFDSSIHFCLSWSVCPSPRIFLGNMPPSKISTATIINDLWHNIRVHSSQSPFPVDAQSIKSTNALIWQFSLMIDCHTLSSSIISIPVLVKCPTQSDSLQHRMPYVHLLSWRQFACLV